MSVIVLNAKVAYVKQQNWILSAWTRPSKCCAYIKSWWGIVELIEIDLKCRIYWDNVLNKFDRFEMFLRSIVGKLGQIC